MSKDMRSVGTEGGDVRAWDSRGVAGAGVGVGVVTAVVMMEVNFSRAEG